MAGVKRGEIWTAASGKDYAGKPRPMLVLQSDQFVHLESVTLCPFTSDDAKLPFFRVMIEPSAANGLLRNSSLMIDKITTIPIAKLGKRVGQLAKSDFAEINRAIIVFLGVTA